MDTGCALRGGVVHDQFIVCVLAADQQHKVNRSVGIELPAIGQRDLMEDKIEARFPLEITWDDTEAGPTTRRISLDDLIAFKH